MGGCKHLDPVRNCSIKEKSGFHNCVEAMKARPKWSASSILAFLQCKQKFYWSYIKGYRGETSKAQREGILFGEALESLYEGQNKFNHLQLNKSELGYDDFSKEKINAIIDAKLNNILIPAIQRGQTQKEFLFQYQNNFFHGFIDVYLDKPDFLDYRIIDIKYTGKPDSYTRFNNKFQNIIYMLSQNETRMALHLYMKPNLRVGKTEDNDDYRNRIFKDIKANPKKYFEERIFEMGDYDMVEFDKELNYINGMLKYFIDAGHFPKEHTCLEPYQCEFYDVCHMGTNIELLYKNC